MGQACHQGGPCQRPGGRSEHMAAPPGSDTGCVTSQWKRDTSPCSTTLYCTDSPTGLIQPEFKNTFHFLQSITMNFIKCLQIEEGIEYIMSASMEKHNRVKADLLCVADLKRNHSKRLHESSKRGKGRLHLPSIAPFLVWLSNTAMDRVWQSLGQPPT